jgi:hypothetical protein
MSRRDADGSNDMNALPYSAICRAARARITRTLAVTTLVSSICAGAHAQAQCPRYVETDAGSAFDVASVIKDSGSPQSALAKLRNAVTKIDAGGGCSVFANTRACEETLTLARKAIVVLQACSSAAPVQGMTHG